MNWKLTFTLCLIMLYIGFVLGMLSERIDSRNIVVSAPATGAATSATITLYFDCGGCK